VKRRAALGVLAASLLPLGCDRTAPTPSTTSLKIVVAGGPLTEIVFALGAGANVVGADTSSVFPAETGALPKVGYQRQLASEGVLSLGPSLLLASEEAGPPDAIEQVRRAGVRVVTIASPKTSAAISDRVLSVGEAVERADEARVLAATMREAVTSLEARARSRATRPRVLFLYARGQGAMMVGGAGTAADVVLSLAGCTNAATELKGYLPLTPEAAVAARPDVVLAPEQGLASLGGPDGLFATPGLAETPAAGTRRVVAVDDLLLLGLGPRVIQAIDEVAGKVFV
jgi:iron complex transport system substrate-binding protein